MSKKIGIITIVKVNNYGAELQAFATQNAIQRMGYDSEIIDYLFYKNPRHRVTPKSHPIFPMSLKKRFIEWVFPKITNVKQLVHKNRADIIRRNRFASFHEQNTRFSKEYRSIDSLYSDNMNYDVYLVGSDQVWNPNNYTSLDPYFLKFAPGNRRKVSYASSLGISSLPDYTKDYYKDAFRSLDAISVREEDATYLVEEVSGEKAQLVLDPTLLLNSEQWAHYSKRVEGVPNKYVLLYEITPCPYLKSLALHLADEMQCRVVRINREAIREEKDEEILNIMDAGPSEFLWLFSNATAVLTNSFHGTAFSINMKKDFFVVTPARKKNNSRQKSLLKLVDLEDRLIPEDSPMPGKQKLGVNYDKVTTLLEIQRIKSFSYLKTAIDGQ